MAYTQVQFIAYVLDTAPQLNPDGSETYLGLSMPALDVDARCALMLRAMDTAFSLLPQASPPEAAGTTLRVFMAPEFFFRGPTGAYEMDEVQRVIQQLQASASAAQWDDWVFVFGTIVGSSLPAGQTSGTPQREIYNFSLVQQGGVAGQGDTGARVVMKELKSGIDFVSSTPVPGGLLLGQVDPLAPARVSGPGREQQQINYDGAGIFQLQGVTWALDICLDHLGTVQRLQRSPQLPGDAMVQLQLVPSCGMSLQPASIVCEYGGWAFNCDGYRDTRHATAAQWQPPLATVAQQASAPVPDADLVVTGQTVPIDSLYASGAGEIQVYPAQAMPPAQTVAGSTVRLVWRASDDWTFTFLLVYGPSGQFTNVLCEITSRTLDFMGNQYFLPLVLLTQDSLGRPVQIRMELGNGSSPFAGAVWCRIDVPGFQFQGNAVEFPGATSGPAAETVW
ncbi:hypothetical protein H5407_04915 [Mitsuaria sp. WAJ17]|uniref:hypothetical protein n=1 Tax=Mitsuaria sp. WAJ17 TaxID=2761452 RepID=UPI0015FFAA33|nr:hypothetical protein [Mitsuaria sp. WAJ17]MBB2484562.1 hypothetical protein [Mitsuaria sp. WAJ17]